MSLQPPMCRTNTSDACPHPRHGVNEVPDPEVDQIMSTNVTAILVAAGVAATLAAQQQLVAAGAAATSVTEDVRVYILMAAAAAIWSSTVRLRGVVSLHALARALVTAAHEAAGVMQTSDRDSARTQLLRAIRLCMALVGTDKLRHGEGDEMEAFAATMAAQAEEAAEGRWDVRQTIAAMIAAAGGVMVMSDDPRSCAQTSHMIVEASRAAARQVTRDVANQRAIAYDIRCDCVAQLQAVVERLDVDT